MRKTQMSTCRIWICNNCLAAYDMGAYGIDSQSVEKKSNGLKVMQSTLVQIMK